MRKVIQPRVIQVLQPEIVEYYCDQCGQRCGTKENPKQTWHGPGRITSHYCRKECSPDGKKENDGTN